MMNAAKPYRLLVLLVCAVIATMSGAPAAAVADDTERPLIRVLALGDSFTAGVGGGDYEAGSCMRSPHSWVRQWANRARSRGENVAVDNYACSGAQMDHFYDQQGGNWPQLSYVNHDYDIVMMTIGGNDLDFGKLAGLCLVGPPLPGCTASFEKAYNAIRNDAVAEWIPGVEEHLSEAIKRVLVGVGLKMHSGGRVVYMGYPSLARISAGQDCITPSCRVSVSKVRDAAVALRDLQEAAVNAANQELANSAEVSDVVVVPVMSPLQEFAGEEPTVGIMARADSALWDPLYVPQTPIPLPVLAPPPASLERLLSGDPLNWWISGYFHPKPSAYGREALMADAAGGATRFGATIRNATSVSVDPIVGTVGEPVSVHAVDNLLGPAKTYYWDFDDNGDYELTTSSDQASFTFTQGFSGSARVVVVGGGASAIGWGTITITEDGDAVPSGEDNCPTVSNGNQSDADADGVGDSCDPTPLGIPGETPGAGARGEPHLVTLDGLAYDLQSVGEFHLITAPSSGLDVQVRFTPFASYGSVWNRVAVSAGGLKVAVDNGLRIYLDGEEVADDALALPDGSQVVRSGDRVNIYLVSGAWVQATSDGVGVRARPGLVTRGLLGNNNESATDDLRTSSGEAVDAHDLRRIHERYADSWRVSDEESLFTYAEGESTATFSDPSFPQWVRTLADFPAADLEAAVSGCRGRGVPAGPQLDDCAFDYLVVGDMDAAVQAAVNEGVAVDPAAARFDAAGVLEEDFNTSVASTFSHPNYVALTSQDEAAGPITTASPYEGAVAGVPRHDAATASFDLVVKGTSLGSEGEVSVGLDGHTPLVVAVGDDPHVVSGPSGGQVSANGDGVTPDGTAYRKYRVVFPSEHFGSAMRLRVVPADMPSGQVLAVDNLRIALVTQPAQAFIAQVPFTTDQVDPVGGSGNLETPGAQDDYLISISGAAGDDSIFFENGCQRALVFELHAPDGSVVPTSDGLCVHRLYEGLTAGTYTLSVTGTGTAMTYSTQVTHRPPPEVFNYAIGDQVEPNRLAQLDVPGAGVLETTASRDVYPFSLVEPKTVVFDGGGWPLLRSALVNASTGEVLGGIHNHHEYNLGVGDYRVEVANTADIGGYSFRSFVKPDAQVFDVAVGA
ncbi:MAG: VWD domain-containing protein, partial [Actinobacteria bacterium]|nr:VWD domain-containing protein [Actinomycetota bacterium]